MPSAPYDTWNTILNAAGLRLREKSPSLVAYSANILDYTQADTLQAVRNAYRRLQDGMCDEGATRFQDSIVITNIPVVASTDPASECYLSWTGGSDGVSTFDTPALPENLVIPLWLSERASDQNANFPPPNRPNMSPAIDGLPKRAKAVFNLSWQWRNDTLYYPGATQEVDFWIYYRSYLPDPVDVGNTRWINTQAQIMRCQDALSWWLCREIAISIAAGATDPMIGQQAAAFAAVTEAQAKEATKKLVNRDVQMKQRADVRRIPYGSGGSARRSGGAWW